MEVSYKVEDDKLNANNHLFLDQLTFGEKVESPTATKLPVLLAVSLLTNSKGEIDINLPISGTLNDPKFSIGGIIIQVIVNVLTKIVTAPFALLASAFGGGEELGYVEFPAGSATLAAEQTKRIDTLAKALNDRPALKVDIIGRVDPAARYRRRAQGEARRQAARRQGPPDGARRRRFGRSVQGDDHRAGTPGADRGRLRRREDPGQAAQLHRHREDRSRAGNGSADRRRISPSRPKTCAHSPISAQPSCATAWRPTARSRASACSWSNPNSMPTASRTRGPIRGLISR